MVRIMGFQILGQNRKKDMDQNLQSEIKKPEATGEMLEVMSAVTAGGELRELSEQELFERKVERIKEVAARVDANLEKGIRI